MQHNKVRQCSMLNTALHNTATQLQGCQSVRKNTGRTHIIVHFPNFHQNCGEISFQIAYNVIWKENISTIVSTAIYG